MFVTYQLMSTPLARPLALERRNAITRSGPTASRRSMSSRRSGFVSWTSAKNRRMPSGPSYTAPTATHSYTQPRTYPVNVTVRDTIGHTSSATYDG